ncbi:transaldolase family protein [Streptomyces sp. MMS24-I2-30]|uniref:transaldolase family protein n=1 Tax=Streptomyces sp. MMS24-I2-30 TaxID=3351564 RepID=UPI00389693F4
MKEPSTPEGFLMLFLDSSDIEAVRTWHSTGTIDGVTTNPSILRKQGVTNVEKQISIIAELIAPQPVAVEITSADASDVLAACRRLHAIGPNVVVKIPIVDANGSPALSLLHRLHSENIPTNATTCFTVGQAFLAAKAGADYVTLFWSRILEEGGDAAAIVASTRRLLNEHALPARILVGSLRRADDLTQALLAGAHVVTAPPELLGRWADHHYARETAAQFDADERRRAGLPD